MFGVDFVVLLRFVVVPVLVDFRVLLVVVLISLQLLGIVCCVCTSSKQKIAVFCLLKILARNPIATFLMSAKERGHQRILSLKWSWICVCLIIIWVSLGNSWSWSRVYVCLEFSSVVCRNPPSLLPIISRNTCTLPTR